MAYVLCLSLLRRPLNGPFDHPPQVNLVVRSQSIKLYAAFPGFQPRPWLNQPEIQYSRSGQYGNRTLH